MRYYSLFHTDCIVIHEFLEKNTQSWTKQWNYLAPGLNYCFISREMIQQLDLLICFSSGWQQIHQLLADIAKPHHRQPVVFVCSVHSANGFLVGLGHGGLGFDQGTLKSPNPFHRDPRNPNHRAPNQHFHSLKLTAKAPEKYAITKGKDRIPTLHCYGSDGWWKKSCSTWFVSNPVNNGKKLPTSTG